MLIPLEKVLEVFTFEKTLAAPMMFRRGGPVAADLESSMAVIDKNQLQAMEGELKEKKILLIQGRAASGKTILIRSMAYHMYKSGNQRIWMLRLKEDPFDYFELIGEMEV